MPRYTVNDDALNARARALQVRYIGGGTFLVASGSRRSLEHLVDTDPYDRGHPAAVEEWLCGCEWSTAGDHAAPGHGRMCSHVRAVALLAEEVRARRRQMALAQQRLLAQQPARQRQEVPA